MQNAKRKERKRFHKKMIIDVILIRMINLHYDDGVQKEIDIQNAQTKKNKRNPLKNNRKVGLNGKVKKQKRICDAF